MSPSCQKCHFVVSPCHFLPYRFTAKELDEETGLYYYGARYLDPKYSRWLSTDPALGEYIPKAPINEEAKRYNQNLLGMGGVFNHINGNLYHYAANNPVHYIDPDGDSLTLSFSWLPVVDGPLPIGDIALGVLFVIDLALVKNIANNIQEQQEINKTLEELEQEEKKKNSEAKPADKPNPLPSKGHLKGKDKGNKGQTAEPPENYPGDDPTKTPDGYEWRGKPGSQPGGKDGSYYDPGTGEVLRPDLDHPEGIDPHWDYKDPSGNWWRWFPGD